MHPAIHAASKPDHTAYRLAGSNKSLSYRQLDDLSNQAAQLFRSLGLGAADHIALLMENCLEFMTICWAAQRSGLYYTAISTSLKPNEAAYIIRDCDAKLLIISADLADRNDALADLLPAVEHRFVVGRQTPGYQLWEPAIARQPKGPIQAELAGFDMLYSSGTTGQPKGVKVPFQRAPIDAPPPSALRKLFIERFGFDANTLYLSPAPLYHGAPLRGNMTVGAVGGTSIIMNKFDAEEFLSLIETHRVTHAQLVPTMFVRLLRLPLDVRNKYDLSSLRCAIHGAGPCAPHIKRQIIDWWGPLICEYYGGTEGNGIVAIDSLEWLEHPGSVGRAYAGEIKIVDDAGHEMPTGVTGTIFFANGRRFEYHKDPVKTAASYNDRGWSTLGDIGYLDDEGFLYLTDRKAFTIISGGVNIYPQEIENVLLQHPKVADAAVFGIPNEEFGEEVKAVVQLSDPMLASASLEKELIDFCKERLSTIKSPRSVAFILDLPRDANGKQLKRQLREAYSAAG